MGIRLGDIAPNFKAETTQGPIDFHEYKKDSWTVLFSHPADFTPVCTTELGAVAKLKNEWDSRGVKVIGLSINELKDHEHWIDDINNTQGATVHFPIIADANRQVALLYDMIDHQDATNVDSKGIPLTVRSVFIIDPKNVIRLIITYPASVGRNFKEIIRVIDSLQLSETKKVVTPADWTPGKPVIVHVSVTTEEATKLYGEVEVLTPYLRLANV
ncbi:hypothetical protein HK096_000173 [Nowakowskiella sp. JEL0078]|nr:hypothetical protein HK096_000173 [Nowakowskiella sp. JEL0078]